jgi:hypothetical protein
MAQSRNGRSGHQVPVGAMFSVQSRRAPMSTQPSVVCVPGLSPGVRRLDRGTDRSLILRAWLRMDASCTSSCLCACIVVSRGDLYLLRKRNFKVTGSQSARSTYSCALKTVAVYRVDICAGHECSSLRRFWLPVSS